MGDLHDTIDEAATRIAFRSRFPTFAGGTYAFPTDDVSAGVWLEGGRSPDVPEGVRVEVPAALRHEPLLLAHARCRILIEDALGVLRDDRRLL